MVTDNLLGAQVLTQEILRTRNPIGQAARDRPHFLGGDATRPATSCRIQGFREKVTEAFGACSDAQIIACSYDSDCAEVEIKALCERIGGLPSALFINSISSFEGVLRYLVTLPEESVRACSLGCFDYEPFGSLLRFPVHMIRQRHKELVNTAFHLLETKAEAGTLITVPPEIYLASDGQPRTLDAWS